MFDPQVVWHARTIVHDIGRLLVLPFLAAIPASIWFWGAGRSDEDGRSRIVSSISLRGIAALGEFVAVMLFLTNKYDLLFIARDRPVWGFCAVVVLASGVVLILWAILSHFKDSSVKLDILDGSETTSKAAVRFLHIENLQTNVAAAWLAGFSVVLYWLVAIAMGH